MRSVNRCAEDRALATFPERHSRLFVLTGAGISTASGIPAYRDRDGAWQRKPPITIQEFLSTVAMRKRYWARSMLGWPILADARPNAAHIALAKLEGAGRVRQLVTQNVDGLHQLAGSADCIELHGNIAAVKCLDCGAMHPRESIQRILELENREIVANLAGPAPDGDADAELVDLDAFRIPACAQCGGMLKPDVVFFGEGVPRVRVTAAFTALAESDAMLVIGSSLMLYSGYRFCEYAHRSGKPIAAVNVGRTRADPLLSLKVERPCTEALVAMVDRA